MAVQGSERYLDCWKTVFLGKRKYSNIFAFVMLITGLWGKGAPRSYSLDIALRASENRKSLSLVSLSMLPLFLAEYMSLSLP